MNALEDRIAEIKTTMDDQRTALLGMMAADPDDFDGREQLWMAREDLRYELDGLLHLVPAPTLLQRLGFTAIGPVMRPSAGAFSAMLFMELLVLS